jgi:pimeloyl-ACP methyl ester carboxylesterase
MLLAACSEPEPVVPEPVPPEIGAPAALRNGSFTAQLNGFNIHYEVHGTGPVLMTVPNSWGLTLEGLRAMYRPLEDKLTLIYFDPRGMGESDPIREDADMGLAAVRADFDALRRHLRLDKVNAIGWSNGGMNLLLLASEKPDTLASAIFLHCAASFAEEDMQAYAAEHPELMQQYAAFQAMAADEKVTDEEKEARLRELWLNEFFPASCADPQKCVALVREVFKDASLSWRHAQYSEAEAPTFEARDRLGSITMPSLVLAGAHDDIPVAKAEEMTAGLPDASLIIFESSGHIAPVEEPEAFRQAVLDFLGVS